MVNQPNQMAAQAKQLIRLKVEDSAGYQLLLETSIRVSKIIEGHSGHVNGVSTALFETDIETTAYDSFESLTKECQVFKMDAENLTHALSFCNVPTRYFDDVLINAEDPKIANNRRSFIHSVNHYFQSFGDWMKLAK